MTDNSYQPRKPVDVDGVNLDDPKHFSGRQVIARQSSMITTPLTQGKAVASAVSDLVLLDDDTSINQCRYCGATYTRATSVIAHAGKHSVNKRRGPGSLGGRKKSEVTPAPAPTSPKNDKQSVSRRGNVTHVLSSDVNAIICELRVIRESVNRTHTHIGVVIDMLVKLDIDTVSRADMEALRTENTRMRSELAVYYKIQEILDK